MVTALRRGGLLISKIHQVSGRIFARMLRERGIELNPAQGRILFVLWERDGLSMVELARQTGLDTSTLTRMLDRLVRDGHVTRTGAALDRRKVLVNLTPEHQRLKASYDAVSADMVALFYQGFTGEEIDRFEGYLDRILGNLMER